MYRNLHPATVLDSKGSDMSMSYSLKLKRYPFVLKNVNTNAMILMVDAHMPGADPMSPYSPYPMTVAIQYAMSIRYIVSV